MFPSTADSTGTIPPVRLLLGCTAVGKTDVSLLLAEAWNAEIVCIDSMQVYRGMDIGTAKPTPEMRARVPHHMLDLADPSESFTAARFVDLADAAITGIRARGRLPLLVAGTPFYLMGVIYGLFDGPSADPDFRAHLRRRAEAEGTAALHSDLSRVDPEAAARIHPNDMKRIERALEVHAIARLPISALQSQWSGPPRYAFEAVGLRRAKEDLSHRINMRVKEMIAVGLEAEVKALLARPAGISQPARAALGYAEIITHLDGGLSLADAVERIKINTRRFAKSQRTWFRKFLTCRWFDIDADESATSIAARVKAGQAPPSTGPAH